MTDKITIYHNPRCSKSRQTLEILGSSGLQPEIVEYLNDPPTKRQLEHVLKLLSLGPRELMRKGEKVYKEAGLDDPGLDRDALIDAMLADPILIERPIVLANGKAIIGRPPESVLKII
ncbi:MAG: arsenate reductase (glutaredoxin) [Gammaproteobacteria bacterium]